ncbi:hypothetical protein BT93_F0455 [Corymbia citriodora subsp. variegata]|nr:hypothetical protein BT93_F0455 [Corymbia citriodora subsp. variegata]
MKKKEMDAHNDVNRGEFTWKISNFTKQNARKVYSEVFIVSGCKWRILVFPEGNGTDYLSLYLDVADSATLPYGWTRKAELSLSVIDQFDDLLSIRKETQHDFTASKSDWGFTSFMSLSGLHDRAMGYLANDTLVIKAKVCLLAVNPPVNIQPTRPTDFDSYFTGLKEIINADETDGASIGSSSHHQDGALTAEVPSLEEVEKAKQSLKECLSDHFKLNVKERLSEALSTLSLARTGVSLEQQTAIETFRANFNDFTSDFLTFEQENAEFELQKLQKDQLFCRFNLITTLMISIFSALTKCHETHILLYKQLVDDLTKEDEELKRKMEEVKSKMDKLLSDWKILWVEFEEAKSGYKDKQNKVAEAEEKKRIAEEGMSRSTTAWSNLKAQFC